jgi:hypothetical protein
MFDTFFPPRPSGALARGMRRGRPVAGVWPALHAVDRRRTAGGHAVAGRAWPEGGTRAPAASDAMVCGRAAGNATGAGCPA